MDFVHKQDGADVVQAAAFERFVDDFAQVGFARQDGRDGDEVTLRAVGDDLRQGGFAGAGRPPQDDGREEFVGFDGAPQQFALADDVILADVFFQRARTHARGQRRFGLHPFLHGVVEEVGHGDDYTCFDGSNLISGAYSFICLLYGIFNCIPYRHRPTFSPSFFKG